MAATVGILPSPRSVRTCSRLGVLAALGKAQALDRSTLFEVIPGFDHDERKRISGVEVPVVEVQSVFERLAAPRLHVAIQAPLGGGIVKAGPSRTDGDLVGMLVAHVLVKVVQVLFSPIAAVRSPSLLSGLHPRVQAPKVCRKLRRRFIFVEKNRRRFPTAAMLNHAIPIHSA